MNLYVDEMPNTVADCLFSRAMLASSEYVCTLGNGCYRCSGVMNCPNLKILRDRKPCIGGNAYQQAALRTVNPDTYEDLRIVEGVMGLAGESGECVDICKKAVFQGHDLDKEHLAKELGDVAWYLAISAHAIGYDLEDIFRMNIEKLTDRYPNGFDSECSVNRKEGDV